MSVVEAVGWFATLFSVISLMPQVWKTWRTRSAHDLSLSWLGTALLGAAGWMAYGWLLPAFAILVTNAVVGGLLAALLAMKLLYKDPRASS